MKIFGRHSSLSFKILIFAVSVFALSASAHAKPESADISITGVFGYDGYFKDDKPAPLKIRISNSGEMFDGWVLANLESWIPSTYYTRPLRIPPGGSYDVEFASFGCSYGNICEVPIELYLSDGSLLKTAVFPSYRLMNLDSLVLHIGNPPSDLWSLFNGLSPGILSLIRTGFETNLQALDYVPKIFPVVVDKNDLPQNPILLDPASLVAVGLHDYLDFTPEMKDLILAYVRHGGNLLIYT
ncbi:MAG TPA: hypothetical protein ENN67_01240, partial [Firmicutes bacterium]|nr:hypothetical protein [Bacillota bacterium]